MSQAPNFDGEYPGAGERIGPGWQAMWDLMADGEWHTNKELAGVAWWLQQSTVNALTYGARKRFVLESKMVKRPVRRRLYRRPA